MLVELKELYWTGEERNVLINTDSIVYCEAAHDNDSEIKSMIRVSDGNVYYFKETYEEVKSKILGGMDSLSIREILDIVLSVKAKEPETNFVMGEILGMCAKKLEEKKNMIATSGCFNSEK